MFQDVLLVVVPAWFLTFGVLFYRHAKRAGRRLGLADVPRTAAYWGSIRSHTYGGGSKCLLEFFDWGIRLRGGMLTGPLVPTLELRYEEIEQARLAAGAVNRGVQFRAACLRGPVTFVTFSDADIARQLEERGVPVNRNVGRLSWLSNE